MENKQHKILFVSSHPVQYFSPLCRLMAADSRLDILVVYCSMQGATESFDVGFQKSFKWDIPLLDGYNWVELKNFSWKKGIDSFWGLVNIGIIPLIFKGKFDAIIINTGYTKFVFWMTMIAAKICGVPFLFGTDSHQLVSRDKKNWKTAIKKVVLPRIFNLADIVLAPSSATKSFLQRLGIKDKKIQLLPYVVDNDYWLSRSNDVNKTEERKKLNIPSDANVFLFSGKLQYWKKPLDALTAFSKAQLENSYLIFAGEGPLKKELEKEVSRLKLEDKVIFLGFVNQSELPKIYRISDFLIFPSEYEPFGLVVNEAMLCGCIPIVSDQIGARFDLVEKGETGFIFKTGNIEELKEILISVSLLGNQIDQMRKKGLEKMRVWSPQDNLEALIKAVQKAILKKD